VLVSFLHCNKSQFWCSQFVINWSHCFGSMVLCHGKVIHLMARKGREKKEGAKVPLSPLRAYSQWPKDLPLGPTF
jgi:hypothetical protein